MSSEGSGESVRGHSGRTSGSAERSPEQLRDAVLTFDLEAELESLKREKAWLDGERNARTLSKQQNLRVVLVAIKAGGTLEEHSRNSPLSVHVIAGEILFRAAGQEFNLKQGRLLTLQAAAPHEVEALEESAFVLTLGAEVGGAG